MSEPDSERHLVGLSDEAQGDLCSALTAGERSEFVEKIVALVGELEKKEDSAPDSFEDSLRKRSDELLSSSDEPCLSQHDKDSSSKTEVTVSTESSFETVVDELVTRFVSDHENKRTTSSNGKETDTIPTQPSETSLSPLLDQLVQKLGMPNERLDLALKKELEESWLQKEEQKEEQREKEPVALTQSTDERAVLREAVHNDLGFHGTKNLFREAISALPSQKGVQESPAEPEEIPEEENGEQKNALEEDATTELDSTRVERKLSESNEGINAELFLLYERGEWRELRERCERSLGSRAEGEGGLTQILWITAQIHLKEVPPKLLSAPLDSLLSQEERVQALPEGVRSQYTKLLVNALWIVSERLVERGEFALASKFAAHAHDRDPSNSNRLQRILTQEQQALHAVPEYERSSAQKLRLETLESHLSQIEVHHSPAEKVAPVGDQKTTQSISLETPDDASRAEQIRVRTSLFQRRSFKSAVGVCFFLGVVVLLSQYWKQTDVVMAREIVALEEEVAAELVFPPVVRQVAPDISAVWYDFEAKNGDSRVGVSRSAGVAPAEKRASREQAQGTSPSALAREQVNTNGPIEPTSFPRREFGSPVTSPAQPSWDSLSPTGDIAQGRASLDQSFQSGVFEILSSTDVMNRPSYTAQSVARLQSGDRVQVLRKHGDWLELRSARGNTGFILGQDAVRFSQ